MPRRACSRCDRHLSAKTLNLLRAKYKAHLRTCSDASAPKRVEMPEPRHALSTKTLAIIRRVDAVSDTFEAQMKRRAVAKKAARLRWARTERKRKRST